MAEPLAPFIVGIPKDTLSIPKTPLEVTQTFPNAYDTANTVTISLTLEETGYKNFLIQSFNLIGSVRLSGTPGYCDLNGALKRNGVIISTVFKRVSWESGATDNPQIAESFELYQDIKGNSGDVFTITLTYSNYLEVDSIFLSGSNLQGIAFN